MAVDVNSLANIGERSASDILELLARPFLPEAIQTRKIGGREVAYVAINSVVARLNKAAGSWDWRIVSVDTAPMALVRKGELVDVMVTTVVGELSIPNLGVRQGIGTAVCEGNEDSAKSAASDALKKAASLFGTPLDGG